MSILFALLTFASSIAMLVFFILAIVKFVKKDSKAGIKHLIFTGASFFGIILFSIIFIFTIDTSDIAVEDESEMIETSTNIEEANIVEEVEEEPIEEKELTPEEQESLDKHMENINKNILEKDVKSIVVEHLGETNNMKKDRINSIVVSEEDNGVLINLNASENFTVNMTKKGMWMDTIEILEPLHNLNKFDIILVNWYLPLVDTYGNESDSLVMSIDMNKETLDKINWENFLTDNLPNVADHYHNHPALND